MHLECSSLTGALFSTQSRDMAVVFRREIEQRNNSTRTLFHLDHRELITDTSNSYQVGKASRCKQRLIQPLQCVCYTRVHTHAHTHTHARALTHTSKSVVTQFAAHGRA